MPESKSIDNKKITQYFVAHKACEIPEFKNARLIQVGTGESFCETRDNTGDNISEKNPNYCELTAMYWIWKNDQDSDYVGINHYRRWFKNLANPDKILEDLQHCDVIVPRFEPYRETVREQYSIDSGFDRDLTLCRKLISKQNPNHPEYLKAFDEVMNAGGIHQYNMMITSKKIFDAYCAWVFPIFEEMESCIDLSGYNDYQKRIYGFLSERLFNVFLKARKYRVLEYEVVQPEMALTEKAKLLIRQQKNRFIYRKNHK